MVEQTVTNLYFTDRSFVYDKLLANLICQYFYEFLFQTTFDKANRARTPRMYKFPISVLARNALSGTNA